MNSGDPIGIFDSGLGGLSVLHEIRKQLPHENIVFFGDSAHNPYGTKTSSEVREFCMDIVSDMAARPVKAVVIACNTATGAAAKTLRETFDFDIIGMEPALKLAADLKTPSKIAVWATELTLEQEKFSLLKKRFDKEHEIIPVACPKLVELVESDALDDTRRVQAALDEYLQASEGAEFIVLGCTHFIFFKPMLQKLAQEGVKIVDGNEGTARQLGRLLEQHGLLNESNELGSVIIENSLPEKTEQSYRLLARLEE